MTTRRARIGAMLLAVAAGLLVSVAGATPAHAAGPWVNKFTSYHTGKAVNASDGTVGGLIRQWDSSPTNQKSQWLLTPKGGNAYEVRNRSTNMCMEAVWFTNGSNVVQRPCTGDEWQQWWFRYDLGVYNQHLPMGNIWVDRFATTTRVLTIFDVNDPGSRLVMWDWYNGGDQYWKSTYYEAPR